MEYLYKRTYTEFLQLSKFTPSKQQLTNREKVFFKILESMQMSYIYALQAIEKL